MHRDQRRLRIHQLHGDDQLTVDEVAEPSARLPVIVYNIYSYHHGILWLNLFHHGDHSIAGLFYDNVVVSRSRAGCL